MLIRRRWQVHTVGYLGTPRLNENEVRIALVTAARCHHRDHKRLCEIFDEVLGDRS